MYTGCSVVIYCTLFPVFAIRLCIIIVLAIFVFCCRDRKRIKARIAERERGKRENGASPETGIEDNEISNPGEVVIDHTTERKHDSNGHLAPEMQFPSSKTKSVETISSYSSRIGIDNMTNEGIDNFMFERSFVDIAHADESQKDNSEHYHSESKLNPTLQSTCGCTPAIFQVEKQTKPHTVYKAYPNEIRDQERRFNVNENGHDKMKKRASSDDKDAKRQIEMKHLSRECLAVKKLMRRHSYGVAIADYTWLPDGQPPPSYASSVKQGYQQTNKKFSLGCENKAYHEDDHKRNPNFSAL